MSTAKPHRPARWQDAQTSPSQAGRHAPRPQRDSRAAATFCAGLLGCGVCSTKRGLNQAETGAKGLVANTHSTLRILPAGHPGRWQSWTEQKLWTLWDWCCGAGMEPASPRSFGPSAPAHSTVEMQLGRQQVAPATHMGALGAGPAAAAGTNQQVAACPRSVYVCLPLSCNSALKFLFLKIKNYGHQKVELHEFQSIETVDTGSRYFQCIARSAFRLLPITSFGESLYKQCPFLAEAGELHMAYSVVACFTCLPVLGPSLDQAAHC